MKKISQRIVSLVLCICMFAGMAVSVSAEETSFSASAVNKDNQTVEVTISAASAIATDGIQFSYVLPDDWTATVSLSSALQNWTVQDGTSYVAYGNEVSATDLVTITYSVPSNAMGTFELGVTNLKVSGDGGDVIYANDISVKTNVTVGSSSTGITLTAAATNDNPVRVGATNPIKVNVGVGQDYAATEMTITYPSSLVSFNENSSNPGTATITDNGSGTLTLADYGADKNAGTANYVLAFTVTAASANSAEFKVTAAGLGTGTSAADANLTAVTELGSVSIAIENAQYNVTMPTDGLFYAATTVVEAGGTFTFYPEQTTGGYYDYTLPTATYADGTSATVTETADGTGWQITNVTGNVTIAAGSRDPKNFGKITYDGTGENKVTDRTENAVYLTDISFTIPADVAAGIENGVKYDVAAKIGDSNYTFGGPTVDSATGARTYTIPGASVTGAVTITVTATPLDATKVTVSIDGNASADGKYAGTESAGASVQIDKNTGSATLTVDTTTGLNKGYNYEVTTNKGQLTKNEDGTYTISGLTQDATITITKTVNVEGVKNQVEINGENKSFVTLDSESGSKMWLIQLPNNVENTTTAVYKYNGKQMYWSADHNNYVIVVINESAPEITADMFTLETVTATPTIASNNWDVNKSGTVDANDAQLIWNMYKSVYTDFSTAADGSGATAEKFMLADANHDGVLNLDDAVVIINQILKIDATPAT